MKPIALQRSRPVSGRRRDDSRGCVRGGGYSVGVSVDWGTVVAAVAGSGITSAVLTHVLTFKRDSTTWERQERVRLEGLRREAFADFLAECDGLANAAGSLPQPLTPEKIRALQAGPERARARLALVTDRSEIIEGAKAVVSNAIMRAATESRERSTWEARQAAMSTYANSRFRLVVLMRDELGRLAPETPSPEAQDRRHRSKADTGQAEDDGRHWVSPNHPGVRLTWEELVRQRGGVEVAYDPGSPDDGSGTPAEPGSGQPHG